MAKRYKLVSEALFSKLLGTQPLESAQMKTEQNDILTSREIPDELKPILYRDYSRRQQDFRKQEEAKPLLVTTTSTEQKEKPVAPEPERKKPNGPPKMPALKNLTKAGSAVADYLPLIGVTWNPELKTVVDGVATEFNIKDVVSALSSKAKYDSKKAIHPVIRQIAMKIRADGAPNPEGHLSDRMIKTLRGQSGGRLRKKLIRAKCIKWECF